MAKMISVTIGGMTVPIEKASQGWINQMFEEARKRGASLCIQVSVQTANANVALATPGCGVGGGGGRPPNPVEKRILDAWQRRKLSDGLPHPGELQAFLNDLGRLT